MLSLSASIEEDACFSIRVNRYTLQQVSGMRLIRSSKYSDLQVYDYPSLVNGSVLNALVSQVYLLISFSILAIISSFSFSIRS